MEIASLPVLFAFIGVIFQRAKILLCPCQTEYRSANMNKKTGEKQRISIGNIGKKLKITKNTKKTYRWLKNLVKYR